MAGIRARRHRRAGARHASGRPRAAWRSAARCRSVRGCRRRPRCRVALCLALVAAAAPGRARPHRAGAPVLAHRERLGGRPHRPARPAGLPARARGPRAADRHGGADACARSRSSWAITGWPCSRRAPPASTPGPATTSAARSARRACELLGVGRCATPRAWTGRRSPSRCGGACATSSPRTGASTRWSPPSSDGDLDEAGLLLDASHRSLRDDYDVSVPAVERARERCHAAGALGARLMGGGFGGSVLALFPPGAHAARGRAAASSPPARLESSRPPDTTRPDGPSARLQEHPHRPDRGRDRARGVRPLLGRGARVLMADEVHHNGDDAAAAGETVHLPGPSYLPVVTAAGPHDRAHRASSSTGCWWGSAS